MDARTRRGVVGMGVAAALIVACVLVTWRESLQRPPAPSYGVIDVKLDYPGWESALAWAISLSFAVPSLVWRSRPVHALAAAAVMVLPMSVLCMVVVAPRVADHQSKRWTSILDGSLGLQRWTYSESAGDLDVRVDIVPGRDGVLAFGISVDVGVCSDGWVDTPVHAGRRTTIAAHFHCDPSGAKPAALTFAWKDDRTSIIYVDARDVTPSDGWKLLRAIPPTAPAF